MSKTSRREFVAMGLANAAALAAGQLILRADAKPTVASGDLGDYGKYVQEAPKGARVQSQPLKNLALTEDNILGPFYREGAPFRAKVTPPMEPGTVLVIRGRVWAFDTKKPVAKATIDIWQASAKGRYDNDDPSKPPAKDVFLNRARLIADENGSYEYETIHPGQYRIGPDTWRPSHIHYLVRCPGYKTLVTQLYFQGDPHNANDQFIKQSLIISVRQQKNANGTFESGVFDIVLARQ